MVSKTKIDKTNYEICGGKTCIDGTNFEIVSGRVLVNGANCEVWLEKRANVFVRKILPAIGSTSDYAIVTINGKDYNADEDLTLPIGTVAVCSVKSDGGVMTITHNLKVVAQTENVGIVTYEHPITSDTTIVKNSFYFLGNYAHIDIYDNGYIRFSRGGKDYMACEGMTWSEWIGSESYVLSNATFVIKDGLVYPDTDSETPVKREIYIGSPVNGTDIIVSNHTYG